MELHLCSSLFRVHVLPPGSIMLRIDWVPTYLTLWLHSSDQRSGNVSIHKVHSQLPLPRTAQYLHVPD